MTATALPTLDTRILDVLTWVRDGQVRSTAPTDKAPVRYHRDDTSSRCITARFAPFIHADLVQRIPDSTIWRLTDDGRAVLEAAGLSPDPPVVEEPPVVLLETAWVEVDPRQLAWRTDEWWRAFRNRTPNRVLDSGRILLPCKSVAAADQMVAWLAAFGIPPAALTTGVTT